MAENLKKEERKAQIKKTVMKLLSKNGYYNVSVQDIIDAMGYSKGGFYNCYSSKEELYKDIFCDAMKYQNEKILATKKKYEDMGISEVIVESLLDKIMDKAPFKNFFMALILESSGEKNFFEVYGDMIEDMMKKFDDFCKNAGLTQIQKINNEEFTMLIIFLSMGIEMFKQNNNQKYRALLKELFSAYFEKKGIC